MKINKGATKLSRDKDANRHCWNNGKRR